jgi:hypothetical protein
MSLAIVPFSTQFIKKRIVVNHVIDTSMIIIRPRVESFNGQLELYILTYGEIVPGYH